MRHKRYLFIQALKFSYHEDHENVLLKKTTYEYNDGRKQ